MSTVISTGIGFPLDELEMMKREGGLINLSQEAIDGFRDSGLETVEFLVPSLSPEGNLMNEQELRQRFLGTGDYLGSFSSPDAGSEYAKLLSEDYNKGAIPLAGPLYNRSRSERIYGSPKWKR